MRRMVFGLCMILAVAGWFALWIGLVVKHNIDYVNDCEGYWSLADKSATIEMKSECVDKYVEAVEKLGLTTGHSAIIFHTFNNDMENNFKALLSLQKRLHEIKKLDITSFAYQTAIQQLTQQEWTEAHALTGQFESKYFNRYAPFTMGVFGWVPLILQTILLAVGVVLVLRNGNY